MHLSRLGLLVHLVASLPWWHPSTSALPWHGSILGSVVSAVNARPGMQLKGDFHRPTSFSLDSCTSIFHRFWWLCPLFGPPSKCWGAHLMGGPAH